MVDNQIDILSKEQIQGIALQLQNANFKLCVFFTIPLGLGNLLFRFVIKDLVSLTVLDIDDSLSKGLDSLFLGSEG